MRKEKSKRWKMVVAAILLALAIGGSAVLTMGATQEYCLCPGPRC